jgi:murein DD-endopeptidase MepM/ murein hydrolase activator NlpD
MNNKVSIWSILFTIVLCVLVFFLGMGKEKVSSTSKVYQIYLSGEKVGVVKNADALYDLIDKEQKALKKEYDVDKIYPPKGLEVVPIYTYNNEINSIKEVYENIKEKEPFTIEGYEVTIASEPPVTINVLNREDLDVAIRKTVESFIDKKALEKYISNTQEEITGEGSKIDIVNLNEKVTVKKTLLSTEEKIFTNSEELSRYMLFGTLQPQSTYIVKLGDTIDKVSYANKLNTEEFLIVNPQLVSEKALLYPGQIVNINLIQPLIGVVETETYVENQVITYETTIEYDNTKAANYKNIKQEGLNGLAKVTFRITKLNGEVVSTENISTEEISAPTEQVIVLGGYNVLYVGNSRYWSWPTRKPYYISSGFKYRWGRMHNGIDITGTGCRPYSKEYTTGCDIFAIQNGEVIRTGYDSNSGNYIYIDHHNGYWSTYLHNSKILVSVGDTVVKGQIISQMGNTGRSTGTHLHLGIYDVHADTYIDPLNLYQ